MADNVINYTPPATIKEFIVDYKPAELFYDWIVGPVGCLHGDSLIVTECGAIPIADIDRPMRVLSWNATTCRFQLSLCGGSFPKGTDYLYRVVTPQGEFDAAGSHLLLCADGNYRRVEELQVGDALAPYSRDPLQTSEVLSRKVSPVDAPCWMQTASDCLGGYATSIRQRGRRLLQVVGTDLAYAPSQGGALVCEEYSCPEGIERAGGRQGPRLWHTHQGLFSGLRRMMRYVHLSGSGAVGVEGQGAEVPSVRGGSLHPALPQSRWSWCQDLREQLQPAQRLWTRVYEALRSPEDSVTGANRPILSITRKAVKETYWDLQVLDTHNYVTVDGAIHHNSGKTTGLFFKLVRMAQLQKPGPDGIRRTRAVVVRNTAPQLRDTTIVSWNYWFKDGQAGTWRATESKFTLRFGDVECDVLFRPLDTPDDVARVLSLEVTFAIFDEFVQIHPEIRDALSARLGRYPSMKDGGATNWGMWGSSNPSTEDNAWYDYLHNEQYITQYKYIDGKITDPTAEEMRRNLLGLPVDTNAKYFLQPSGFSPDAENIENLPGGVDYYHNQAKGKSQAWVKQFLEAEWGYSVSGKPVVPTFNPDIHLSPSPLKYDPQQPIVIGFDPGIGGSAFIFGQDDLHGRLRVYGELVQTGMGTERLISERLKPYLRKRFPGCKVIIAPDPAAANRAQTNEKSVVDVLKKHYEVKYDTNNRLAPRLDAIEHYTTRLTDVGPALLIDARECPVLVRGLKGGWRFVMDPKRDIIKGAEPEKNHYSHPGDAFGYLARHFARLSERAERYGGTVQAFKPPRVAAGGYHFR